MTVVGRARKTTATALWLVESLRSHPFAKIAKGWGTRAFVGHPVVLGLTVLFPFGEAFEAAVDEGAEVPAVEVFVGGFAGGVVAAGEDLGDVVDLEGVEVFEDVEGVLEGEGEVVGGVDDEGALGGWRRSVPCRTWG